eukprot:GHVU01011524.1.p2 GENE.GHVU01011524.1~~GHVU01011524.1.p2  ORF type:complete len:325 (-),score=80.77 GHVU01011524.1:1269-2243(-)
MAPKPAKKPAAKPEAKDAKKGKEEKPAAKKDTAKKADAKDATKKKASSVATSEAGKSVESVPEKVQTPEKVVERNGPKVTLVIVEVTGVPAFDEGQVCSPYVDFEYEGERFVTDIKEAAEDAEFNQTFTIVYSQESDDQAVKLKVHDNGAEGGPKMVGQTLVDLSDAEMQEGQWLEETKPLKGKKKGPCGSIKYKVLFGEENPELNKKAVEEHEGCVSVTISGAKELKALSGLAADPFARFIWRDTEYKTRVVKDTLTPTWGETFTIPIDKPDPRELKVEIVDGEYAGEESIIGLVFVDFTNVEEVGGSNKSSGEIVIFCTMNE